MRELFIYYRVDSVDSARVPDIVRAWQRQKREANPHLVARLLRRPAAGDAPCETWLETYSIAPGTPHDFEAALIAELAEGARSLAPLIVGTRHVEVFVACAS